MNPAHVPIEPAATLILVRDSEQGPQILMQQRSQDAAFVGGAWVFPGGKLDQSDFEPRWLEHCDLCQQSADQLLEVDQAAAYWGAAIRETVEEAGILMASDANRHQALALQQHLQQQPDDFLGYCRKNNIQLSTNHIQYVSRWITPQGSPKRYDTRFFIAPWPHHQPAQQDGHEAVDTVWITPQQALENHKQNQWLLILPTLTTLQQLCHYDSCEAILSHIGQSASKA